MRSAIPEGVKQEIVNDYRMVFEAVGGWNAFQVNHQIGR